MKGPVSPSAPMPQSSISVTNSQSRKRRGVQFSLQVSVRTFYTGSRSTQSKENLWYSPQELRQQRVSDLEVVGMIRQAGATALSSASEKAMDRVVQSLSQHSTWSVRGLEHMLDGGKQKSQNKFLGVLTVLMEQDRQVMEGDFDESQIAVLYHQATKSCQEEAHHRAMMDREDVDRPIEISSKGNQCTVSSSATKFSQTFEPVARRTVLSRAA